MTTHSTLRQLLHPFPVDDFLKRYWQKRPLLIDRRDTSYHEATLSLATIDKLLASRNFPEKQLKIVANGLEKNIVDGMETRRGDLVTKSPYANFAKAMQLFHNGGTTVLNGCHRVIPALAGLVAALENETGVSAHVNAYLTPPAAVALKSHFDRHDTIILQLAGTKLWSVFSQADGDHQNQSETIENADEHLSSLIETELSTGDTLYIPAGIVHRAKTGQSSSLHLTIGLRRGLDQRNQSPPEMGADLVGFGEFLDADEGRLQDALTLDQLSAKSIIEVRGELEIEQASQKNNIRVSTELLFIELPAIFEAPVRQFAESGLIAVGSLTGLLTDNGKLELARHLVAAGIAKINDLYPSN